MMGKIYQPKSLWVRRLMIVQILICAGLVIWMAVATLAYDETAVAEQALTAIAEDYYENYFYDKFADGRSEDEVKEALAHYAEPGFRELNLVQLLNYDGAKQAENARYFEDCDQTRTAVKIWPEEPYGKSDYRLEVKLVCDEE